MAKTTKPYSFTDSFDIVVESVIATIELSPNGTMNPYIAAFEAIGAYERPGRFTFPNADGSFVSVVVTFDPDVRAYDPYLDSITDPRD